MHEVMLLVQVSATAGPSASFSYPRKEQKAVVRTLLQIPKMSTIEGFHSIAGHFRVCGFAQKIRVICSDVG